jgi:hypothetical protein
MIRGITSELSIILCEYVVILRTLGLLSHPPVASIVLTLVLIESIVSFF